LSGAGLGDEAERAGVHLNFAPARPGAQPPHWTTRAKVLAAHHFQADNFCPGNGVNGPGGRRRIPGAGRRGGAGGGGEQAM
jgi:hypothetical protein